MAVKNPVISIIEVQKALAAEQNNKKVIAVSEANIASNIESLYQTNKYQTVEEKAQIKLIAYREALEEEKIKARAAEEARLAQENINNTNKLITAGLKATYVNNYVRAERIYGVPWQVIAAVHRVETNQNGNTTVTSYAGAQGPMQFMPATWRAYAQDANGDGTAQINNVDDAIYTAANYLAANGGNRGNVVGALYHYNHDMGYVNHVLSIARSIGYAK